MEGTSPGAVLEDGNGEEFAVVNINCEKPRNISQPAEKVWQENLQSFWPLQHLGEDFHSSSPLGGGLLRAPLCTDCSRPGWGRVGRGTLCLEL